jgi:hypothetical protein
VQRPSDIINEILPFKGPTAEGFKSTQMGPTIKVDLGVPTTCRHQMKVQIKSKSTSNRVQIPTLCNPIDVELSLIGDLEIIIF